MTLQLTVQDDAWLKCDLGLSTRLATDNVNVDGVDGGEFVWTSTVSELKTEEEEVIEVLADACVRHYAMSDQLLSRFEDESFEGRTLAVEVT